MSYNKDLEDEIKPIGKAPRLATVNGIGTTIYGESLTFVFLGIPLFWLGRYEVECCGYKEFRFYGKKKLHTWQIIWNVALPIILLLILFIIRAWNSRI